MLTSGLITFNIVAPPPTPSWVPTVINNGMDVGCWGRITGPSPHYGLAATNTPRSVKSVSPGSVGDISTSGMNGMVINWSGGPGVAKSLGTFGTYIFGPGGGHAGYRGNDIFGCDLDTRVWSEKHANQNVAGVTYNTTFGEYSTDGSPGTVHTYDQNAVFPATTGYPNGGIVIPVTAINVGSDGGNTISYAHIYDLSNGTFTRGPQLPPGKFSEAGTGIWDPGKDHLGNTLRSPRFIMLCMSNPHAENILATLDLQSLGAYTDYSAGFPNGGPGYNANGIEQVAVIDPVRDLLITFDLGTINYFKLSNLAEYRLANITPWRINQIGTPPATRTAGPGAVWSTKRQSIIYWQGSNTGANVYELKYDSGNPGSQGVDGTLVYRWSLLTSVNNQFTPTAKTNNPTKIYDGFSIQAFDDKEFVFVVTNVDEGLWAFRIA